MLTRLKIKRGEGLSEEANLEIGCVFQIREMASPRSPREHPFGSKEDFFQAFMKMQSMVKETYKDRKKAKEESCPSRTTTKVEGEGGDHPENSSSSSSSSSSSGISSSSFVKKHSKKSSLDLPLLKLDIKFDLPIYDGEINAKKLDNWVRKMKVYCRIQNIMGENTKIQLDTL
jgi:hypothetical protein